MATICPKCRHIRQPNENAPDWQCPACGVAYAKATDAEGSSVRPAVSKMRYVGANATPARSILWGKLILIATLIWGGWMGVQVAKNKAGGISSIDASLSGDVSAEALSALAATVKPGEVVMYSTTECPYCAQARAWLNQYGFPFTECNMSVSPQCEQEFAALGANGTPYLIVRGYQMKDGFDSDEFLAALGKQP